MRAGNDLGTLVTKVLEGWDWCCDSGLICDLKVFATGFSENFSTGPALGRPKVRAGNDLGTLVTKVLEGWDWCCGSGVICDLQNFATGFSEHFSSGL